MINANILFYQYTILRGINIFRNIDILCNNSLY